ncbi:MAG: hypothetical protein Q8830_03130 [Candidatus Phytoplasma australasiaticum]|nr:hypothetical protein [Candidatus Phytoplasma australasiaticum]
MNVAPAYPIYGHPKEDITHIFFQCRIATHFWNEVNVSNRLHNKIDGRALDSSTWMDCWKGIKNNYCSNAVKWDTLFPFCLWQIWKNRNSNIFEQKANTVNVSLTHSLAVEYVAMTTFKKKPNHPSNFVQVKWNFPANGMMKMNTDGAIQHTPGPGGLGGIFQNDTRNWQL